MVVFLVNQVNSDTTFLFASLNHCLVDMFAIHSFATIGWQECRMYVDYLIIIGIDEVIRDFQKKTSEYNMCNPLIFN